MAQIIGLPKLSPTMEEGVLVRWTKKEGDKVSPGDLVAEVETDKANMDFNIEDDGVLLKLLVKEGDTVRLGAPVAIIGKAGEDVTALVAEAAKQGAGGGGAAAPTTTASAAPPKQMGVEDSAQAPAAQRPTTPPEQRAAQAAQATKPAAPPAAKTAPTPSGNGKILASPLAKTLAIELGIDLRTLQGSGPGGRIVERDVRAAAAGGGNGKAKAAPAAPAPAREREEAPEEPSQALAVRHARQMVPDTDADYEDVPASNVRKRIAVRLTEAKRDVPHFYLMRKLDAAPLLAFRARLNDLLGDRGKVSVNDLIIKAVALALRRVPECNAAWEGDAIRRYNRVHIGVAVAIEDGLVTPVVRDADQKGIGAIAAEVKDLAERAKRRGLKMHEIQGSTFSVSNLGMFGIERFTAIINPPEAGILAVGTTVDEPVVGKDGAIVAGKRLTVTMSCDHRVIDGALGARWLQAFAELFEKPESLAL
ncbi:MAG TPA: pyruvate dehydrogenase complex dihydrolipoamide acetyltransferase [Kofleriaceae bacterium]|jgi:pyruvate dehydrogenase E2 component (dihydrolipoamide acetyltransferase)|nr:pyruvate dehydrogenase complex dihydrolipoamide acetyltransferase [Kofleriaceae bacterium]